MHFARHATDVTISVKNPKRKPNIIAPRVLVAAKVMPKSSTDVKIVPRLPQSIPVSEEHIQFPWELRAARAVVIGVSPKYTTAIPKSTQRNAGVTVTIAVKRRIAAIMPTVMLDIRASTEQSVLQLQFFINITSCIYYVRITQKVM